MEEQIHKNDSIVQISHLDLWKEIGQLVVTITYNWAKDLPSLHALTRYCFLSFVFNSRLINEISAPDIKKTVFWQFTLGFEKQLIFYGSCRHVITIYYTTPTSMTMTVIMKSCLMSMVLKRCTVGISCIRTLPLCVDLLMMSGSVFLV